MPGRPEREMVGIEVKWQSEVKGQQLYKAKSKAIVNSNVVVRCMYTVHACLEGLTAAV